MRQRRFLVLFDTDLIARVLQRLACSFALPLARPVTQSRPTMWREDGRGAVMDTLEGGACWIYPLMQEEES